jgi:hypothetical protein
METISQRIDGEPQGGDSGRTGSAFDPATGKERARIAFHPLSCPPFCPP